MVHRFVREGARVALLDTDVEAGRALESAQGGAARFHACDVSDRESVDAAFRATRDELGPVDVLVNNAGIAHIGNVEETSSEDLDRIYRVNVQGVYHCLQAAMRDMRGAGRSHRGTWPRSCR